MEEYSSILRWLWFGSGFIGYFLLSRAPGKFIFDDNFHGAMLKMVTLIALPLSIIFGPISILVAAILPERKLCSHCFKAIQISDMYCTYCGQPQNAPDSKEDVISNPKERFSKEVQAVVAQGIKKINLPISFIMIGFWVIGLIFGILVLRNLTVMVASFFVGFIAGWLWWSYKIPRWRKWALEQPGVNPDELQAAAEIALLVWPKGHFFEKTEIKPKK